MDESQVPYPYDAARIASLKASLSESRFATYLTRAGGNEAFAFELYLYNARLAKTFLFPLSIVEVTLRNAVDGVLQQMYGDSWHQDDTFCNTVLTAESLRALDKAMGRVGPNKRDKVIAELTFDFWSNLFRSEYANLWRTKANIAFPGLAHGEGQQKIQSLVKEINHFRNRVAHHEPILDMNVTDLHSKIIKMVKLRCAVTADWLKHYSKIHAVIRTKPKPAEFTPVTLGSRADKMFEIVERSSKLSNLTRENSRPCSAFVCVENGGVVGAFTYQQLGIYMTIKSRELNGMVDLNDHTVADILNSPAFADGFSSISAESPFFDAIEILDKPKTRVVVAVKADDGMPVGVVLRAHRRY